MVVVSTLNTPLMVLILSLGLLPNVSDGNLRNPLDAFNFIINIIANQVYCCLFCIIKRENMFTLSEEVGEPGGVAAFSLRRKRLERILELVFLVGEASTFVCESDVGPCGVDGRAGGCCTCSC